MSIWLEIVSSTLHVISWFFWVRGTFICDNSLPPNRIELESLLATLVKNSAIMKKLGLSFKYIDYHVEWGLANSTCGKSSEGDTKLLYVMKLGPLEDSWLREPKASHHLALIWSLPFSCPGLRSPTFFVVKTIANTTKQHNKEKWEINGYENNTTIFFLRQCFR